MEGYASTQCLPPELFARWLDHGYSAASWHSLPKLQQTGSSLSPYPVWFNREIGVSMSVDYYMACGKCMQCIHVAQDGLGGWTFYSGEPDCMQELGEFLGEHSGCYSVLFLPEYRVEDMEERMWRPSHQQQESKP